MLIIAESLQKFLDQYKNIAANDLEGCEKICIAHFYSGIRNRRSAAGPLLHAYQTHYLSSTCLEFRELTRAV